MGGHLSGNMLANPSYCNLARARKDGLSRFDGARPTGDPGLHDDNLIGRNQVQGRANPFVEQVGIEVIGFQFGDSQIKLLAPRPNRFEIGIFGADLAR